jgi:putative hemolysin
MSQPDAIPPENRLVDLEAICKSPVARLFHRFCGGWLERVMGIRSLNELNHAIHVRGDEANFFATAYEEMGIQCDFDPADLEAVPKDGPVVLVANHPFGGADAVLLGHLMHQLRPDAKIMANYLVNRVRNVRPHMITVDPFVQVKGSTTRNTAPLRDALRHLKQGGMMAVFPGNSVAQFRLKDMRISENEWSPHIAALIRRTKATVVPVFFGGTNSLLFQFASLLHPMLRTALLARELQRRRQPGRNEVHVTIGRPIPFNRLDHFAEDRDLARFLRLNTLLLSQRPRRDSRKPSVDQRPGVEPVAPPADVSQLENEILALPPEALLARQGPFEVYIGDYDAMPGVMHEIGRCREISFRATGGGTLTALDLAPADEYYKHVFLWDKAGRVVAGAYRVGFSDEIIADRGPSGLICSCLFKFSSDFISRLNPGIELGRSVILPAYQRKPASLSLIWKALCTLIARNPKYHVIFGSVGISQGDEFTPASRTLIVEFMRKHFSDAKMSLEIEPVAPFRSAEIFDLKEKDISGLLREIDDVSTLISEIEQDGKGVPVLIRQYIRMNAKLLSFGVWEEHSKAVVSFIMADLVGCDERILKRFMGKEGYEAFMAYHRDRKTVPVWQMVQS